MHQYYRIVEPWQGNLKTAFLSLTRSSLQKKQKNSYGGWDKYESTSAYIESLLEKLKNIFSLSHYLQLL